MKKTLTPGSIVGVLGSGQLGRMFAIAARRMGYRVHTFSPDYDTPTGQVADVEISASYDDLDAVRDFASKVDVITFEFENVPAATAAAATEVTRVRPSGDVLHITQNRLREKSFLAAQGIPVARFAPAASAEELDLAVRQIGGAVIAKTAGWGYDGKGQRRLPSPSAAADVWSDLGGSELVVEETIDFECEASIIVARGIDGSLTHFDVTRNVHRNHILDVSSVPSQLPAKILAEAVRIANAIAEGLQLIGVLCVELFITKDGRVLVNELAPRPHNSGHWTFDGCMTSQFEQQLRAVCGLPLGSTEMLRPAAMVNLLGDLWLDGEPDWRSACSDPDVKLHLYGKTEPRKGRKMGHITVLADSIEDAVARALAAREKLKVES